MFIALSTFTIANEMGPEVKQAFRDRPHFVDNAPGFQRMEVICPQDEPNEIWLITYWTDQESYTVWHKNHLKESHSQIPKGLKLVPRSAKVRFFEHVSN